MRAVVVSVRPEVDGVVPARARGDDRTGRSHRDGHALIARQVITSDVDFLVRQFVLKDLSGELYLRVGECATCHAGASLAVGTVLRTGRGGLHAPARTAWHNSSISSSRVSEILPAPLVAAFAAPPALTGAARSPVGQVMRVSCR